MKKLLSNSVVRGGLCLSCLLVIISTVSVVFLHQTQGQKGSGQKAATVQASPTPIPESDKINRETSDPYKGNLSIFEDSGRDEKLQIERVMDLLKIKEGAGVADIGAGSGWFTVRAARRVGEKGVVYAVDINPDSIKYIDERAVNEKLNNIRSILGKEDDPTIPEKSVDAVLILKTYHEFGEPIVILKNLKRSLKKNALVGIIDKNGEGRNHGVNRDVVISEAERAGYVLVEEHDFVKGDRMDYFLIFRVK